MAPKKWQIVLRRPAQAHVKKHDGRNASLEEMGVLPAGVGTEFPALSLGQAPSYVYVVEITAMRQRGLLQVLYKLGVTTNVSDRMIKIRQVTNKLGYGTKAVLILLCQRKNEAEFHAALKAKYPHGLATHAAFAQIREIEGQSKEVYKLTLPEILACIAEEFGSEARPTPESAESIENGPSPVDCRGANVQATKPF